MYLCTCTAMRRNVIVYDVGWAYPNTCRSENIHLNAVIRLLAVGSLVSLCCDLFITDFKPWVLFGNKMSGTVSNLRRGKALGSQAQEVVYNVYKFMNEENRTGDLLNRVAQATGVSRRSVANVVSRGRKVDSGEIQMFETPGRKKKQPVKNTNSDDKSLPSRTVRSIQGNVLRTGSKHPVYSVCASSPCKVRCHKSNWVTRRWLNTRTNKNSNLFHKQIIDAENIWTIK